MPSIQAIKNYTLTTSFAAITIPSDLFFTQYTVTTEDYSDFSIRIDDSGSVLFPISVNAGTSPLQVDEIRQYSSDDTTLFYAKGETDANLCILFWRE